MKIKHKYKPYLLFSTLFVLFVVITTIVFLNKERKLKKEVIMSGQVVYANIVSDYISENQLDASNFDQLSNLLNTFPKNLHLSVLNEEGYVLFDNKISYKQLETQREEHRKKPEIRKALLYGKGWNIRETAAISQDYDFIYYAVHKTNYIIRVGLPNTTELQDLLQIETGFLIFVILVSVLTFALLSFIYWNTRQSINKLKQYIFGFRNGKKPQEDIFFQDEELNEIQSMIFNLYNQFDVSKKENSMEREKLLEHFYFAEEGISFFTPEYESIYTNAHFIQYLNILLNEPTFDVSKLFMSPIFYKVVEFLQNPENKNSFSTKLYTGGSCFFVHVIIFDDKSFEIIIRNISESEKNNLDRAEITNNIAHELKTPVTSIRGYLETIIDYKNLAPEKRDDFIRRAYIQVMRLSEIIHDVILLSKTSDAPQTFNTEEVNIYDMLQEIIVTDAKEDIEQNKYKIDIKVPSNVVVKGNRTLLHSIFRNLGNNAVKYAGENITITIHNYMEDDYFYYFSFADNGKGIDETHLNQIFERFYRVTEGRTRDKGGSGLGLAIVKDAVAFHNGEILAKNRAEGGLEFLFTIRKK
jgi:signal transduction histidine kinase